MKEFSIDPTQESRYIYAEVVDMAQGYRFKREAFGKSFNMIVVHNSIYKKITDHCSFVMGTKPEVSKGVKMTDAMFIGSDNIDEDKIYFI